MGKVRDEAPAKATKAAPPKSSALRDARNRVAPFFANLLRADIVKPNQGRQARLWTAVGLGVLLAAGVYRLYEIQLRDQFSPVVRFGIPVALLLVFGWLVFRIVQYPPFVDFLIATEAEMNKVSWTSKADLQRATSVVLVTVVLMSLYLFGVDFLWLNLLRLLGVLSFDGAGGFGAQVG
ncbi:MAG: preprotein translocase subunit SecE [Isosphaeraceae bacterium]|nr:preprotein translocase subunit SecE [Isosphaeraceae bacterium]